MSDNTSHNKPMSCKHGESAGIRRFAMMAAIGFAPIGCQNVAPEGSLTSANPANAAAPARWVVQGPAEVVIEKLYDCPVVVDNYRGGAVGQVRATDGTVLTVPAVTAYERGEGPSSVDLYNECTGIMPRNSSEVSTDPAPIIDVDPDGEVVTGYIVADNYYELYVNGTLVSVDNTPYTPFNSAIVKFRAKRPYTLGFFLVDWDEHLGLGMELFSQGPGSDRLNSGDPWYTGDAGLIARFSDGTVTDGSWKAQSFSIAPLDSPDEVIERGGTHDTSARGRVNREATRARCAERGGEVLGEARLFPALASLPSSCYAVHYPVPANWDAPAFDDSGWPQAYEYTDAEVGTTNLPAYNRYPELFEGARWIWSINLVLDNTVIARKTVR
jgi:hypothetical protein